MYSVVIIDDEVNSRRALRNMLARWCPDVEVRGEAEGVATGVSLIRKTQPDAVFLDVRMDDGMGFDLVRQFPNPSFNVIFTTGYGEYAIEAIRHDAVDYLLKPIDPEELVSAVRKLSARDSSVDRRLSNLMEAIQNPTDRKISLSTSHGWTYWKLGEIVRLEGSDNMTFFYNDKAERILTARTLGYYEDRLPADYFFRCHKSHIVNKLFVREVSKKDGDYAVLENDEKVPISRRRLKRFLEWLDSDNI